MEIASLMMLSRKEKVESTKEQHGPLSIREQRLHIKPGTWFTLLCTVPDYCPLFYCWYLFTDLVTAYRPPPTLDPTAFFLLSPSSSSPTIFPFLALPSDMASGNILGPAESNVVLFGGQLHFHHGGYHGTAVRKTSRTRP